MYLAKNVPQLAAAIVVGKQVESRRFHGVRHRSLVPGRGSAHNLAGAVTRHMFEIRRSIRRAKARERLQLERKKRPE